MGSLEKCPQVDRAGLGWQGQLVDIQLEYSWSISLMLNNAPNYLGREAPVFCLVQILHIMTILSLQAAIIGLLHRSSGLPSVCLIYSHRIHTAPSDLAVVLFCPVADWRIFKCSTSIVVDIKQLLVWCLVLSGPQIIISSTFCVEVKWCSSRTTVSTVTPHFTTKVSDQNLTFSWLWQRR